MSWIKYNQKKPPKAGWYYWKGKSGYGGYAYFDGENFVWHENVPRNKVDVDYLLWLNDV